MTDNLKDIGGRFIYGGIDEPQPNWRDGDPDDELDDNEDPIPMSPGILEAMLGFDPTELDEEEEEEETEEDDE